MIVQLNLLRDFANDCQGEHPLLTSGQFQQACQAGLAYLESLQQHFRLALGISHDFVFKSAVRVPDFLEGRKTLPLNEFTAIALKHAQSDETTKAELQRQLIAYAMQAGDQASLSLTHYLLENIEKGSLKGFEMFLARFTRLSCLLPVRFSSISASNFIMPSEGVVPIPDIAQIVPAVVSEEAPSPSMPKQRQLKLLGDIESRAALLKTAWQEGGYSPLEFDDFLASLEKNKAGARGSIAKRLAKYHPAVFVRMMEEIARARKKNIAVLDLTDFSVPPEMFKGGLRSVLYYLLAACGMDPYQSETNYTELYARLKQLAGNFKAAED